MPYLKHTLMWRSVSLTRVREIQLNDSLFFRPVQQVSWHPHHHTTNAEGKCRYAVDWAHSLSVAKVKGYGHSPPYHLPQRKLSPEAYHHRKLFMFYYQILKSLEFQKQISLHIFATIARGENTSGIEFYVCRLGRYVLIEMEIVQTGKYLKLLLLI